MLTKLARFEPKKVAHIGRNHWHKSNRFIQRGFLRVKTMRIRGKKCFFYFFLSGKAAKSPPFFDAALRRLFQKKGAVPKGQLLF